VLQAEIGEPECQALDQHARNGEVAVLDELAGPRRGGGEGDEQHDRTGCGESDQEERERARVGQSDLAGDPRAAPEHDEQPAERRKGGCLADGGGGVHGVAFL
jgi:hypothetical protein